jgi:hypothetical protein
VIAWQGNTRDDVESRIRECEITADKVMRCPANGGLMFDRHSLDDVPVYELPSNGI